MKLTYVLQYPADHEQARFHKPGENFVGVDDGYPWAADIIRARHFTTPAAARDYGKHFPADNFLIKKVTFNIEDANET